MRFYFRFYIIELMKKFTFQKHQNYKRAVRHDQPSCRPPALHEAIKPASTQLEHLCFHLPTSLQGLHHSTTIREMAECPKIVWVILMSNISKAYKHFTNNGPKNNTFYDEFTTTVTRCSYAN